MAGPSPAQGADLTFAYGRLEPGDDAAEGRRLVVRARAIDETRWVAGASCRTSARAPPASCGVWSGLRAQVIT